MRRSFGRSVVLGAVTSLLCLLGAQVAGAAQWSIQSTPNPPGGGNLRGVSCASDSSCIAVGRRFSPTGLGRIGVVESWDGTRWSFELVPKPSGAVLNGVSCPSRTRCVAVGMDLGTE